MNIILYTIDCPKCKVLEKKMKLKGIEFEACHDVEKMRELGISSAPQVQVDGGPLMDFREANKWVNAQEVKE
jgi:glutaredoxin